MEESEISIDIKKKSLNWIWVLAAVISIAIICCCVFFPDTNNSQNNTGTNTQTNFKSGITYENYCRITNGMTYGEVVEILGKSGKLDTEAGYGNYSLKYYTWEKETLFDYIVIVVGFENNKVVSKSQIGL